MIKSFVTQFRSFNSSVAYNVPHENKQINKQGFWDGKGRKYSIATVKKNSFVVY